jgi:quercetin dioxygenase-like cupin family protein
MNFVRMYADSAGDSHFQDVAVGQTLGDYSPPTPPVYVSPFTAARQVGFVTAPAGWIADWHPVPGRQLFLFLRGEIEVQVSDSEVRRFRPGSVLLGEDTAGRGHRSRVLSDEDADMAVVHFPD